MNMTLTITRSIFVIFYLRKYFKCQTNYSVRPLGYRHLSSFKVLIGCRHLHQGCLLLECLGSCLRTYSCGPRGDTKTQKNYVRSLVSFSFNRRIFCPVSKDFDMTLFEIYHLSSHSSLRSNFIVKRTIKFVSGLCYLKLKEQTFYTSLTISKFEKIKLD